MTPAPERFLVWLILLVVLLVLIFALFDVHT